MVTAASLKTHTSKDLAQMAKKKGVSGWHSMKKDQLVKALLKVAKQKEKEKSLLNRSAKRPANSLRTKPTRSAKRAPDSAIAKKIRQERERTENLKNLSAAHELNKRGAPPESDRLILVVRDSYWLQAYWEITRATVQRAKAAMAGYWHTSKPVLRLLEITSDGNTNSVESIVEEVEIHSGVNNWYMKCDNPGKTYRVAVGYLAPDHKFHLITKSNEVTPPTSNSGEGDDHWTDITNDVEKYYALSGGFEPNVVKGELQAVFEEKSRQPMHAPAFERLGSGINGNGQGLSFQVDAHMIVHGSADPNASVTIAGEPVRLQNDGTFALRLNLPDRRQVLPVVASSRDGTQQRTTVLAVERNTKVMEPVTKEFEH
ncbi:MAG: DUF4912 domain-containing protein [Mariniblastus sp.]|nr:DUF4912 domain-containing protein [Mariniblastus sp.]